VEELAALRASDMPLRILDVRSDTSFASSESLLPACSAFLPIKWFNE